MSTKSYIIAGAATLAIVGWFAFNSVDGGPDLEAGAVVEESALPSVVVTQVSSELHDVVLTTYGRTQPHREVQVRAKTAGPVVATPLVEGRTVKAGAVVCRQDMDARQAVVAQASAALRKAEADLAATRVLVERGFKSGASLNSDQAALDSARAQLSQAQTERGNITMLAPFDGVFTEQLAELGDYLGPGQPCGTIVELSPLVVEAELSETQVGKIAVGDEVPVRLASGEQASATVTFIQSIANTATRTFTVETEIPNDPVTIRAGMTASLDFGMGRVEATPVPSGILSLSDDGNTGVRYLDADNIVRFAAVETIDETDRGIWVTGLPSPTRIIIEGQDFVSTGTEVDARTRNGAVSSRTSPVAATTRIK